MSSDYPDFFGCSSYYRVTDEDALKSLLKKHEGGQIQPQKKYKADMRGVTYTNLKRHRNNQMVRYFRQLVWETGKWESVSLYNWIESFSPEIILLFSGNNAFIDKFALKIASRYNIPIVLYNCEDYFLKEPKNNTLFARINKNHCDKTFKKTMRQVKGVIYNSFKLQKSYENVFGRKNDIVLMNAPSTEITKNTKRKCNGSIVYLGNVAVGREYALAEIADALAGRGLTLDIYGNILSESTEQTLLSHKNIRYHGVVSYSECCAIMKDSRLLVHGESFCNNHEREIRHAFTTKFADCLASETPLLVYAPSDIALTEYIAKYDCAVLATSFEDLKTKLDKILDDDIYRAEILKNARMTCLANHDKCKIDLDFKIFLSNIVFGEFDR